MNQLLPALALLAIGPATLSATWSIVAVDPATREVGSAGASCTDYVAGIVKFIPGQAVVVAQAMSNSAARNRAIELLNEKRTPADVVKAVANPEFDKQWQMQQYGVAALGFEDASAAFTGTETSGWKGDKQGFGFSAQGNILTGPGVLDAIVAAFTAAERAKSPLADRLLAALEAGAAAGGDSRCGEQRARSSYLVVAKPTDAPDAPSVGIVVAGQWQKGGANAIKTLRTLYDVRKK
jgi:uncharacterized Ntn-hydrolase superfamily protein